MASMGGGSSAGEDEWPGGGGCGSVEGIGDLLQTLSTGTRVLALADLGRGAVEQGPLRLPKSEDRWKPAWAPPPSKEEVKKQLRGDATRNYKNCVRCQGDFFSHAPPLKPGKTLDTWQINRVNVPERTYAKETSQPKADPNPREFMSPPDDFCTPLHREWLAKHRIARDKEMHPVYHALVRLDKATAKVNDIAHKKAMARDILSREHAVKPQLGGNERRALSKVRAAVAVTRMFNRSVGIDRLADEEERAKVGLAKAKSAPCLRARPITPRHRVEHLRGWGPANANSRQLRATTPWIQDDDARELARRGAVVRPASVA